MFSARGFARKAGREVTPGKDANDKSVYRLAMTASPGNRALPLAVGDRSAVHWDRMVGPLLFGLKTNRSARPLAQASEASCQPTEGRDATG